MKIVPNHNELLAHAAREAIFWHGEETPKFLSECAEAFDALGEVIKGDAMRDIAYAAEGLLRTAEEVR